MPDLDLFRPLAWEVVTLAESLSQARNAAENEARLREASESMWTADRLAVQVQTRLDGGRSWGGPRDPLFVRTAGSSVHVAETGHTYRRGWIEIELSIQREPEQVVQFGSQVG